MYSMRSLKNYQWVVYLNCTLEKDSLKSVGPLVHNSVQKVLDSFLRNYTFLLLEERRCA